VIGEPLLFGDDQETVIEVSAGATDVMVGELAAL
jgi:hypothetical protein